MAISETVGFADERPRLTIRQLKNADGGFPHGLELMFESAGLKFIVTSIDGTNALIVWEDQGEVQHQLVDLTTTVLRFGERVAFDCPVSGKACHDLYLFRDLWASATGHGLPKATRYGNRYERQQAKLETIRNRLLVSEACPK